MYAIRSYYELGGGKIGEPQPQGSSFLRRFDLVQPLLEQPGEPVEVAALGIGRLQEVDRFDSDALALRRQRFEARDGHLVPAVRNNFV